MPPGSAQFLASSPRTGRCSTGLTIPGLTYLRDRTTRNTRGCCLPPTASPNTCRSPPVCGSGGASQPNVPRRRDLPGLRHLRLRPAPPGLHQRARLPAPRALHPRRNLLLHRRHRHLLRRPPGLGIPLRPGPHPPGPKNQLRATKKHPGVFPQRQPGCPPIASGFSPRA